MQKAASVSPLRPVSLRSSASFRTVLATGRRRRVGDLVIVGAVGQPGSVRYGLVTGRRIGSAVVRNRAKRRLREAIRATGLPDGYDFVVIAGPTVPHVPFSTLVTWISEARTPFTARSKAPDRGQV
ncbi:MAG TPA: ribonuclease P protein component [Acidimicrobiia bacterium]|nr:ribonuclease P protein component [Acidimicrobiia bacterium]